MKEKKKSDLSILLGYTGSYKGLTFLGRYDIRHAAIHLHLAGGT